MMNEVFPSRGGWIAVVDTTRFYYCQYILSTEISNRARGSINRRTNCVIDYLEENGIGGTYDH